MIVTTGLPIRRLNVLVTVPRLLVMTTFTGNRLPQSAAGRDCERNGLRRRRPGGVSP